MKKSENRIWSMILLRKTVSLNNIYINESHWPYTLQIISHRLMEIFLILKRLGDNLTPPVVFLRMSLLQR